MSPYVNKFEDEVNFEHFKKLLMEDEKRDLLKKKERDERFYEWYHSSDSNGGM